MEKTIEPIDNQTKPNQTNNTTSIDLYKKNNEKIPLNKMVFFMFSNGSLINSYKNTKYKQSI
jgi:hypothetical protein